MTFLQPFVLWGLPLLLLPVIIHLINRLRHKPQPWAAMMFLIAASRASTSQAKLRQWLVLLFRVLAVAALIFFLARPLAGGWLGWAVNRAPDVIVIVLDRSASMETRVTGQTFTRRQQALKHLEEAAAQFQEASHLILLDSATGEAQRLASASSLRENSLTGPTDTAADLPALLHQAHKWLLVNQAGVAEVWIASDLQQSNWLPQDDRWRAVIAQFAGMPQPVRVRLLAFDETPDFNRSVALAEINRPAEPPDVVQLGFDLQASRTNTTEFPVELRMDGQMSRPGLKMDGTGLRWRHSVVSPPKKQAVWGSLALPADANERDNQMYFVPAESTDAAALIVTEEPGALQFASLAAMSSGSRAPAAIVSPAAFPGVSLAGISLIVWQATLPGNHPRLSDFVREGGVLLLLPTGRADNGEFLGVRWNAPEEAPAETPFTVRQWVEQDGPLARTEEGLSLPLADLVIRRRQPPKAGGTVLAAFADEQPLLTRASHGRGTLHACATVPAAGWSSLDEGPVLVPLLQRLLRSGARRLGQDTMAVCGELSPLDRTRTWLPVEAGATHDPRLHAGVYRSGERLLAVNRPSAEDQAETVPLTGALKLFGTLPVQALRQSEAAEGALGGEAWRMFLFGMLGFLIVESALVLPPRPRAPLAGTEKVREGSSKFQ